MKVMSFCYKNGSHIGVITENGKWVVALKDIGIRVNSIKEFISKYDADSYNKIMKKVESLNVKVYELDKVIIGAPLSVPHREVICIENNYDETIKEWKLYYGQEKQNDAYLKIRTKQVSNIIAPCSFITSNKEVTDQLDYGVELAVIMGKRCRSVRRENISEYIFGYTAANNLHARNLQSEGKSMNTQGKEHQLVLGPCIVTEDEFSSFENPKLKCSVNGEIRQVSDISRMLFSTKTLVHKISTAITLYPGDIILTGTPGGSGMAQHPPAFLKAGDTVECEITHIGSFKNRIS